MAMADLVAKAVTTEDITVVTRVVSSKEDTVAMVVTKDSKRQTSI